jgi:hypothetical protein
LGSLWIGPPGRLRAVADAATDFDRSADLGVSEFSSLSGGVTVSSLATPPRRMALSWTGLDDDTAGWLDALARRVFGPVPLAVLDPAARNLLDGPASQGSGPVSAWQLAGSGTLATQAGRTVTVGGTASGSALRWRHPHWIGWPVPPGVPVSFTSALAPAAGMCVLDYLNSAGLQIGASPSATVVTAVPPAGTWWVRPAVLLSALSDPVPVGPAWLSIGEPVTTAQHAPIGDGCPAMSVTGYTDKPRPPRYRDMSLTLVEVRRARS